MRLLRCLPVTDDIATGACDQQHAVAGSDSGDDVWRAVLVEHQPVQPRAAVLRQGVDVPADFASVAFLLQQEAERQHEREVTLASERWGGEALTSRM